MDKNANVKQVEIDKYGKIYSIVNIDNVSINEHLIHIGYAYVDKDVCVYDFCSQWMNISGSQEVSNVKKNVSNEVIYYGDINSGVFHSKKCKNYDEYKQYSMFDSRQKAVDNGFVPCVSCTISNAVQESMYLPSAYVGSSGNSGRIYNSGANIDDRIRSLESDIRNLNSQKRMDKSMERDGLRREIAAKEEMLNELYMVRDGVSQDQISLIKQKKNLNSEKARLEGEKASLQAEMMRLENDKRDAEREAQELERENRRMETEKRQMEANRIFNWP